MKRQRDDERVVKVSRIYIVDESQNEEQFAHVLLLFMRVYIYYVCLSRTIGLSHSSSTLYC